MIVALITQQSTHMVSAEQGDSCLTADRWGASLRSQRAALVLRKYWAVWGEQGRGEPGGVSWGESSLFDGQSTPEWKRTMAGKGRVYSARQSQLQDSSDSDSDAEPALLAAGGPSADSLPCSQVIHSGHFMVSSPHSDSAPHRRKSGGSLKYDFDTVNRTGCQTYRYGPLSSGSLSIDPTLTRLFDCMSLAYRWVPVQRQDKPRSLQLIIKICRFPLIYESQNTLSFPLTWHALQVAFFFY